MKKTFTYSVITVMAALLFTGCVKETVYQVDNSYWFTQERGDEVYSSNSCGYYVVETNYGYTITSPQRFATHEPVWLFVKTSFSAVAF